MSRDFIEFVRWVVPIEFAVACFQTMQRRRHGKELIGYSPFNREHSPSFTVVAGYMGEFFHDFSSGKHGDVIKYLVDAQHMTSADAVAFLLAESGAKFVPEKYRRHRPRRRRTRLRGI